jgi:hypothetical protein
MLTPEQINSIHRLRWAEHWSVPKIARHLHVGRRTISQYLVTPARRAAPRQPIHLRMIDAAFAADSKSENLNDPVSYGIQR